MKNRFLDMMEQRRSIYRLNRNVTTPPETLTRLIKAVVKQTPSAFNSQSTRVVVLFGEHHQTFWELVKSALAQRVPEKDYPKTEAKIDDSFASGMGTVLFYEDRQVVDELQKALPLYAEHFPFWSEQASAMAQFAVWVALTEEGLGASLQHYNPLIDNAIAQRWKLPDQWVLRAQMPFGGIDHTPHEKTFIDDAQRFKVFL
ncbi:nitroreductase family protein [Marinobacter daepoensis]|uniref:nitroreductase family protein n=1 Tax=Marinobacter daepoensis TaxID=262077 RepID=UPI0003FD1A54|nr:nitroreductase family protein [Marinobacter daepoensis]